MAKTRKRVRKRKLIRDLYIETIPQEDWVRLRRGGKQHLRYLKAKLQEEVDELRQSDYKSVEEYADVIEVLKCLCFYINVDWREVEREVFRKQCSKGKFLEGILLINTPDGKPRSNGDESN